MYTAVTPLSKYLQFKSLRIYDLIFTLHSKCTMVLLLACSCLLSAKQYFGDPIECISDYGKSQYVESFCWTMGTYVYDCAEAKNCNRSLSIYEGVSPLTKTTNDVRLWLRYYQWVIIVLLVQAVIFYFPSFLWKVWEGGHLKHLCSDVGRSSNVSVPKDRQEFSLKMLFQYFTGDFETFHLCYMAKYWICELLNLLISIANLKLLDVFLNGFWSKYFLTLITIPNYDWNLWNQMSSRVFPKVAKCDVYIYGSSGSKHNIDALCLLSLNILNEKIFAFLWCWFLLMTLLAAINLLYRIMLVLSSELRLQLLRTQIRSMPKTKIQKILKCGTMGDWFMLFRVSMNTNPVLFRDLMQQLYEYCERRDINTVC